jgi:hypothetical protein
MSEEAVSPQPDEPSSKEGQGPEAPDAVASSASAAASVADLARASSAPSADTDPSVDESAAKAAYVSADTRDLPGAAQALAQAAAAAKVEGDISMRRSPWKSSMAAIRYVQEAAKTDFVQIRTSDRLTIIALLFFCIAEVLSLVYTPLHGFRFGLMCCCDAILGACVFLFLIYRIGILSALNTRQALICWQMMMGCVFLGIFLCLNAIFAIAYLVEAFFPHPLL